MNRQPLISVIIPTYNRLDVLAELIESLWRQTYRHLQIIVVNDNGEPVDELKELYPELDLTMVDMESNLKHVHARNRGLELVRGDYIMLCDDDDLLLPSHVERMLREIEDSDLVYSVQFSVAWDWDFYLRAAEQFRVKRVPAASALYAFADSGNNMSGNLEDMRPYLDKLSAKHGLGELPTKNFFLLLEEPEVKARRAETELLWNGEPVVSRRAKQAGGVSREA
ncbi:hypothetical protein QJ48_27650 [Paenibacillus sp. A3]|uniref:glycosyltransferase family 2 protein n=1 Tax=Paenibacillus sp. A3 TaxID=1337054 RepID=UPI0006D53D39|nr:glycosyltransferase family 2 protein [Paenibacillus sp. A3]KPV56444.1 hypothetical protein QJ48_27650 [Paenibacillus sp. A3]